MENLTHTQKVDLVSYAIAKKISNGTGTFNADVLKALEILDKDLELGED